MSAEQTQRPHDIFADIYRRNLWGSRESVSGPGSELARTRRVRMALPVVLRGLGARSMLDAPCGDFNWMKEVDLPIDKYIGCDIVPEMIAELQCQHADGIRQFVTLDLAVDALPKVDLIFSRDCLQHLTLERCQRVLTNFLASGARFLLTSSHGVANNQDLASDGGYRPLNLRVPPFSFPEPLLTIPDDDFSPKALCLWELHEWEGK